MKVQVQAPVKSGVVERANRKVWREVLADVERTLKSRHEQRDPASEESCVEVMREAVAFYDAAIRPKPIYPTIYQQLAKENG